MIDWDDVLESVQKEIPDEASTYLEYAKEELERIRAFIQPYLDQL